MNWKKETDVQDIKETEITKYYVVSGKTISFRFQNVFTGMVNGKKELLDEVLIPPTYLFSSFPLQTVSYFQK